MILDNEQQRNIILELVDRAQFPGSAIDIIADFKRAVKEAPVQQGCDTQNLREFGADLHPPQ
jgi:hypothetical protein